METLSELEGVVLGLVGLRPSPTACAIRTEIAKSRSSHWRGSAGSVYPAIQRLVRRRLIVTTRTPRDLRGGVALRLSTQGRLALKHWLGPPLPGWVGAPTFDPIRTRVTFLDQLVVRELRRLLDAAIVHLQHELASAIAYSRSGLEDNPPWERWIALGTVAEIRARLGWVRAVRLSLGKPTRSAVRPRS